MPRTFSRGTKFDASKLFEIFDRYLTTPQADLFRNQAIIRFCPVEGLIELDILDTIFQIRRLLLENRNRPEYFLGAHTTWRIGNELALDALVVMRNDVIAFLNNRGRV